MGEGKDMGYPLVANLFDGPAFELKRLKNNPWEIRYVAQPLFTAVWHRQPFTPSTIAEVVRILHGVLPSKHQVARLTRARTVRSGTAANHRESLCL
jgi:hypothetical protein